MNKIILASTSPRRKELLEREGIDFIIDASSIDEIMNDSLDIDEKLMDLACRKAKPIHLKYSNDIVIGADTVVVLDGVIIGKAKNRDEARCILTMLSNREHIVITAVALYIGECLVCFVEKTVVQFKDISCMIDEYINTDEWVSKAGAYGIQGIANSFVECIQGDIDNVIGLPVRKILDIIENHAN